METRQAPPDGNGGGGLQIEPTVGGVVLTILGPGETEPVVITYSTAEAFHHLLRGLQLAWQDYVEMPR